MMVIGVLSVLLAIVIPTIKTVHAFALKKKARAEATALVQAAIRYKTEYGFWPGQVQLSSSSASDGTVKLNNDTHSDVKNDGYTLPCIAYGNRDFLTNLKSKDNKGNDISHRILRLYDDNTDGRLLYQAFSTVGDSPSVPYPSNPLNPKAIPFLPLQNEHDHRTVDYRDPWNQSYVLIMGLNPHVVFTYELKDSVGAVIATHSVSNHIAFAFSRGSPADHGTNYIYSAGVR